MKPSNLNPINAYRSSSTEAQQWRLAPYVELAVPFGWPATIRELVSLIGSVGLLLSLSVFLVAPLAGWTVACAFAFTIGTFVTAWLRPSTRVIARRREALQLALAGRGLRD